MYITYNYHNRHQPVQIKLHVLTNFLNLNKFCISFFENINKTIL